ncbi:MAG: hypothetical protein H3C39_07005 [Flavobacteriia bacterium]|nr:hypothetical protein [Flavobacteriia bacterium]
MKTITLEVLSDSAFHILKELEKLNIIRFRKKEKEKSANKTVSFSAVSLDTQNFRFNREEANER